MQHYGPSTEGNGWLRGHGTDDPVSSPVYPAPATLRHQQKRTPEEIAALAGISPATWRSWEQGHASPDPALLRRLWKIADALALSDADDFEVPRLRIGLRPADFT
ncbi:hypothetical protein AD950_00535 [Gluconobacter oxydans]|nr:hypothetical protein AD950_00535 [Gluconobacter oxydans]